ncbi:hypothetical protein [Thermoactinomyces sp. DSM 45892]|uniref:hypothetical protein n=1 Tax=Thermoactinomyces sp. DSM 45892 TaxID=1882753 RepID=UPI000896915C|nr:hypothetical protein [Thermoactinomyces sp. DSM 45892]SDZ13126.1 hypothetical protein SAMN05444416_11434 [Thermoactinomyces sp. DSM 45892]
MIISRRALARAKLEKLKQGFSVYTEIEEIAQSIEKKLDTVDFPVHIDRTDLGCWFIPDTNTSDHKVE